MIDSRTLEELSRPSLRRFLPYLLFDFLVMAGALAVFHNFPSVLTFIAASVVLGIFQHALPVLAHEAVHYRISSNRRVNEWIGNICFFPVGITVSAYRDFHFPHHQAPFGEHDPELPLRRAIPGFGAPFRLTRGLRIWVLSFFGFSLKQLGTFVSMIPKGNKRQRAVLGLFWLGVLGTVAATGTWSLLGLWVVSLATTYFAAFQVQGWYEHGISNVPACRYALPSVFFRLVVPHNIWMHYEHHKYPSVPFYNLPKVRALDTSDRVYRLGELIDALHANPDHPVTHPKITATPKANAPTREIVWETGDDLQKAA